MMWLDIGSVWRGVRLMSVFNNAKWAIKWMPKRIWLHAWTPMWHKNNGPYISCGLYLIAFYRGY